MKDIGTKIFAKQAETIRSVVIRNFDAETASIHNLGGLFDKEDYGTGIKAKIEVEIGISGRIVSGKLV